jgi:tetratricopeptide (TPR) repeat protein
MSQRGIDGGDSATAVRVTAAIWLLAVHGHLSESRRWLDAAVMISHGWRTSERVRIVCGAAWIANALRDIDNAERHFGAALGLGEALDDSEGTAPALTGLGRMRHLRGDLARAAELYEHSRSIFRQHNAVEEIGWTLTRLGLVALEQYHDRRATALVEESRDAVHMAGYRWGSDWSLL